MKRILVTGGDGTLGRSIVNTLAKRGQTVRVMSRKPPPEELADKLEWAQADVITKSGVEEALQDIHTIVNCMSDTTGQKSYETDIVATRQLLTQAKTIGAQYVLHISIIGIDRIMVPYYQYKLGSELVVVESGIPYSIARIAQFHNLVDYWLSPLHEVMSDEVFIPIDIQFQSISPNDVAHHLAPHIIDSKQVGRLVDFGGPEVLRLGDMAKMWLDAQGMKRTIKTATVSQNDLSFFDTWGDSQTKGYNTNPDNFIGEITWQDYLNQTYDPSAR